jgi:hypothetical protein
LGKALVGGIELAGAAGMVIGALYDPALLVSPAFDKVWAGLVIAGIASEAGAIADDLAANRGDSITVRQPASPAGIIYGEQRVGGVLIYASTTGSHHDQYNKVVALCAHPIDAIVTLYLDGRQVHWSSGSAGQLTEDGVVFGGAASGSDYYDPGNNKYNFGGLVYAEEHVGKNPAGNYSGALNANDPVWGPSANGTPYGGDVSYSYVKVEYDSSMFPSEPEMRFTVRGKNNIYDPRTQSTGYTTNWALIVADVIMNADWGLNAPMSSINTEQWIAAANLCDELVPLANGQSEPRYTYNGSFDTSSSPGDILASMMTAAGGNLVFSGGEFYIFPAVAYSTTATFTENDLIAGIQGSSYKSNRDLFNRVSGIFTCPNYPFSPTGNLYDANGFDPDGYTQNNFNLQWQKTSYPPYAQDTLHGYPSDQWLAQDGGQEKWTNLDLPGVISLATAQRLAKIHLLRNRLQPGTYTFKMKLNAFQMMPMDVFSLTYPQLGWTNKLLQVSTISLTVEYPDDNAPFLCVDVTAVDYNSEVYAWTIQDELTILDAPAAPMSYSYEVLPPTSITLLSGAGTDIVNVDGIVVPRVEVTWTDPQDVLVTQLNIQWSKTGLNNWVPVTPTPIGAQSTYILGLSAGMVIDVQVQSQRANGATSSWIQVIGYTVSATSISRVTSIGVAPGIPYNVSNDATIDTVVASASADTLRIYGPGGVGTNWDLVTGQGTYSVPPTSFSVNPSSSGYVVMLFPTGANLSEAGSADYITVSTYNGTVADNAILVGSFVSVAPDGTGGSVGGGGTGGDNGGGSRGAACTVEGTPLDTPDGPISNILLKNRLDLKSTVYVSGENGPELLVSAKWVWQRHVNQITVGDVTFECSDTHTLAVNGVHSACSTIPSGTLIDTRTGLQAMTKTRVRKDARVLKVTLSGPSHVYSVGGVLTHNAVKAPLE